MVDYSWRTNGCWIGQKFAELCTACRRVVETDIWGSADEAIRGSADEAITRPWWVRLFAFVVGA